MRIDVCDDDQNFCKEMLKYLQDYFKEKKLKQPEYVCFSNGEAMMKAGGVFDTVSYTHLTLPTTKRV